MTIDDEDLHAYVDGRLPVARRKEVERALEADPALVEKVDAYLAQNRALHARYDAVLDEPVPRRLRPAAGKGRAEAANLATMWPRLAGMAAMLALGIGIGIGSGINLGGGTGGAPVAVTASRSGNAGSAGAPGNLQLASAEAPEGFARQAAVAHVIYMPDIVRPANLGADREQDFVQWLADRLGTNAHPPMLTKSGFELVGGRLLPDDNGEVAQFMYRDAKGQRVTLCISRRSQAAKATAFRLYQDGSVNVFYWVDGDFGYAVSGGIGRDVLLELSHDVHAQLESRAATENRTKAF